MSKKGQRESQSAAVDQAEDDLVSGMINAAPLKNKSGRYLRLPPQLPLFDPKPDVTYRLIFFPWVAGANNPAAEKGKAVMQRFLFVHKDVGIDREWHLCPQKTLGTVCAACQQKAEYHKQNKHRPWDQIKEVLKSLNYSNREVFLLHDLEGKLNNLQVWEESAYSFGDHLRRWVSGRPKFRNFASIKNGMVVEVSGSEKKIGTNSFTEFNMISFSEREEPLSKDLIAKAAKYCIDDFVFAIPSDKFANLFLMSNGEEEETGDEEKPAKKTKKATSPEDDDEDDTEDTEEEEEEDETEDEEDEKPAKKTKKAPPKDEEEEDEDESDDEDSDDEEDESEEEEEKPTPAKKAAKKKKPAPPDEEEEEDEEEIEEEEVDEEDETDDEEDEEEEKPAPKKPVKKKAK